MPREGGKPRENGWYSRRYKTSEEHAKVQRKREERVFEWEQTMARNAAARAKRSPAQQIKVLDKRLGKGKGARKERARLTKLLAK